MDIIGGIDVYSDKGFRPWTDGSLYIPKGNVHMNGKMAIAFARERYAYNNGDLQLENVDVTGSFSDAAIYVTATTTVVKHYSGDVTSSGTGRAVYIDSGTYYYYNGTIQNTAISDFLTKRFV